MLNENMLKNMAKFCAIYEIVLDGPTSFDEIKKRLINSGMPETSARRYVSEFHYPFCSALFEQASDGRITVNQEGMEQLVFDIADWLGVAIIPTDIHESQMHDIHEIMERDSVIDANLTQELHGAYHKLSMQKDKTAKEHDKWEDVCGKKKDLQDLYDAKVKEMNSLCENPRQLLKQLWKSIKILLIKKIRKDEQEKQTSGPVD